MSIKQAIEALESCDPGDYSTGHVIHPSYDEEKVNAALAALRSMPAEPVANSRPLGDCLMERIEGMTPEQLAQFLAARARIKAAIATRHTEAVRMSEAEILALWSGSEVATRPVLGSKKVIAFARAVEQATAARLGVKMSSQADQLVQDQLAWGVSITQGGKRIDPADVLKPAVAPFKFTKPDDSEGGLP